MSNFLACSMAYNCLHYFYFGLPKYPTTCKNPLVLQYMLKCSERYYFALVLSLLLSYWEMMKILPTLCLSLFGAFPLYAVLCTHYSRIGQCCQSESSAFCFLISRPDHLWYVKTFHSAPHFPHRQLGHPYTCKVQYITLYRYWHSIGTVRCLLWYKV